MGGQDRGGWDEPARDDTWTAASGPPWRADLADTARRSPQGDGDGVTPAGPRRAATAHRIGVAGVGISVLALLAAVFHAVWPAVRIDGVTAVLLIAAAVPWLGGIFSTITFPGGTSVTFRDLETLEQRVRDTREAAEARGARLDHEMEGLAATTRVVFAGLTGPYDDVHNDGSPPSATYLDAPPDHYSPPGTYPYPTSPPASDPYHDPAPGPAVDRYPPPGSAPDDADAGDAVLDDADTGAEPDYALPPPSDPGNVPPPAGDPWSVPPSTGSVPPPTPPREPAGPSGPDTVPPPAYDPHGFAAEPVPEDQRAYLPPPYGQAGGAPSAPVRRPAPTAAQVVSDLARSYTVLRTTMSSGSARTAEQERLFAELLRWTPRVPDPDVPELLHSPDPGTRLAGIALANARPDPELLDPLSEVVLREALPFLMYWGLEALGRVVDAGGAERVPLGLVRSLRSLLATLPPDTDRRGAVLRLLTKLDPYGSRPSGKNG